MLGLVARDDPQFRLAIYGSLAPGRSNHHHVAMIQGQWTEGWIEGVLHDRGWGAGLGFPGLVLEAGGPHVRVQVLESPDLPDHWARLDAFEGEQYERREVTVHLYDGRSRPAFVYTLRDEPVA